MENRKKSKNLSHLMLTFSSKRGKDITSFNSGEKEVLYKNNQSFIVRELVEDDGIFYILAEEKDG